MRRKSVFPRILLIGGAAIALVLVLFAGSVSAGNISVDNTVACVLGAGQPDPYSATYCKIQDAIADAAPGDTVTIANSTYAEYLIIGKDLTLLGASQAGVLIDASSFGGYGIEVSGDYNVTLKQFTLKGPSAAAGYGIKIAGENAQATIQNVTVQNSFRSGIDLNGLSSGLVDQVTLTSNNGAGLALTDCSNVTISNITTSGNTWGGVALFTKGVAFTGGSNNITLSGTNSFGEVNKLYIEVANGYQVTNFNQTDFGYMVRNATTLPAYTFYQKTAADAVAFALALPTPNKSTITSTTDGSFYVGPGMSIQAAVDAASPGGVVNVAAGTYVEDVTVNKALSLLGAGAGSTTISGAIGGADSATVRVNASNVTVAGFTITREGNNTTDWNNPALNTAGIAVQGMGFTNMLVRDNILTGNRTAIDINNSSGHTIRNNAITFNRTGVLLRNQTDTLMVVENEITDNWTVGILFLDASGGSNVPVQTALNSTFSNNDLSGNWYGQIVDRQTGGALPPPGTTNLKNFSGNWLGTTTPVVTTANSAEPGYSALIPVAYGGMAVPPGGQPDIAGAASANVDYTPYLATGTDTNVETTPGRGTYGFQGDFSTLWVSAAGAQTGSTGRIQEGVDLVSGSTVNVTAGTYPESVLIDTSVTLNGAKAGVGVGGRTAGGPAESIIDASGLPVGVAIKASNGTLDGFDIVGDASTYAGVMVYATTGSGNLSNITVKNNFIHGMALPNPSSTAYVTSYGIFGLGDAVSGVRRTLTGLAIQDNAIYDLGGAVSGPDTSAGAGVWLYGVQGASAGLGASITGNTFDNIATGLDGGVPEPGVGVAVLDDGDANPDMGASIAGNTYSDTYGGVVAFVGTSSVAEAGASFTNVPMLVLNVGNLATVNEATLAKYAKTNKPTGYPFSTAYFAQIGEAVKQSDAGATVTVAAGTFAESQVLIDKAMTVQGAGSASTILDGGSATGLPAVGLVRIVAPGNVTFDGFTVKNAGDSGTNNVRVGIYASSPNAGVTYTISHNKILGSNNPADDEDYGFYSHGGLESLVFTYNEITQTGANAILLEQHTGPTDVSYNTFDRGVADGSNDAYFNMNYGGADITSLQKVSHNTVDVGTGTVFDNAHRSFAITMVGDFTSVGTAGGFTNVQITDNTIQNLKAYRRGIGLWNNGPGAGASGNITGAVISGNTITGVAGNTGSIGVRLLGLNTNTSVSGNTISQVDYVFRGQPWNGHIATGAAVNQNNFSNSATGFDWQGAAVLNAETNWWGSPCGPSGAGPGNGIAVSVNVDLSPWWTTVNGPGTAGYAGGEFIVPAGSTTPQIQAILDCAGPGSVVKFASGSYPGGLIVNTSGVTIKLNSCTIGHGSPAFTINGNDVTISGPGALDGNGDASPGILVQNAGNFTLQNAEVREWLDGIQVIGNVVSLKVTGNWIHDNADAGLQVDGTPSGVITIKGNLFKANSGDGVVYTGSGLLAAGYNSWGDLGGPNAGVGDGANAAKVAFTPWTFAELFMDVNPPANALTRNVVEATSFDVALKADAAKLYGMAFKITYDPAKLTLNSTIFASPWAGACTSLSATAGTIKYRCNLQTPTPEYDATGGTIATFNFTALAGPPGNGPWPTYFDISHLEADTSTGAAGGVKVYVNNAGFGAPSTAARAIADGDDGEIIVVGLANFTGFVDLQGNNNDGGATLIVYNQLLKSGSVGLASGTSVASGAYTTSYINPNQLLVGTTYWLQFDAPLQLPTTTMAGSVTYPSVPTSWTNGALLTTRPTTPLAFVVLLGGDATNNNVVDIFDAGCIGSEYENPSFSTCSGVPGTSPDVVVDGAVNIYDLVLMGSNYELTYSPWSQLPPP